MMLTFGIKMATLFCIHVQHNQHKFTRYCRTNGSFIICEWEREWGTAGISAGVGVYFSHQNWEWGYIFPIFLWWWDKFVFKSATEIRSFNMCLWVESDILVQHFGCGVHLWCSFLPWWMITSFWQFSTLEHTTHFLCHGWLLRLTYWLGHNLFSYQLF